MRLVALRRYDNGTSEPCLDRLYKRGNVYALHMMGGEDPEKWSIYTPRDAQRWLDDLGPDDDTLTVYG